MELVDLTANVHRLLSRTAFPARDREGYAHYRMSRPGKCSVRETARSVLAIGLDPSTAATAIMDSHLHIARGPFFGHAREAGGLVVGVWSSKLKPSELGPKAMNCTFWLLLPAPCATPLSVPVKRHRALHLQH